jgi:hypothetical protein
MMPLTLALLAVLVSPNARQVDFFWNKPQSRFLQIRAIIDGATEYVDLEGAVRAGKSTPAAAKLGTYAVEYPKIHMAATRWTQESLDAQIKPLWRSTAQQMGLHVEWHGDEQYDEIVPYGSRVYLRGLKPADDIARLGKLAGLTLAVLWIDQPEEVEFDIIQGYIPARLSQKGYPLEAWFTPNPPGQGHWLANEAWFPEVGAAPHHHYLHTSVYDNRANLPAGYIESLEAKYPVGSALRRRFIEGKRGLSVTGNPVYQGYFDRARHCVPLTMNPDLTLYEAWDFGTHRPCVVWAQFTPWGALHLLGGVMGEDIYIEDFAPLALAQRAQWFPGALDIHSCCDPAGTHANSQGTSLTGVRALHDALGYTPRSVANSNSPDLRSYAIQTLAAYMRRRALKGGEAFHVDAHRWRVVGQQGARTDAFLPDGFEAGYVWDDRIVRTAGGKAIEVPKKDGFYEHGQNDCEYLIVNFGPAMPTQADEQKIERQLQKRLQNDSDPDDAVLRARVGRTVGRHAFSGGSRRVGRRGGY